jgi:hypothetical protein
MPQKRFCHATAAKDGRNVERINGPSSSATTVTSSEFSVG